MTNQAIASGNGIENANINKGEKIMQSIESIYNRFKKTKMVRRDEEINGNGNDILNQAVIKFLEKYDGINPDFMPEKTVVYEIRNFYRNIRFVENRREQNRNEKNPTVSADTVNQETETSLLEGIADTSISKRQAEKRRADLIKIIRSGIRSDRVFSVVYGIVFEGKTMVQLASKMACSEKTVSRLFHQGIELLKANQSEIKHFVGYEDAAGLVATPYISKSKRNTTAKDLINNPCDYCKAKCRKKADCKAYGFYVQDLKQIKPDTGFLYELEDYETVKETETARLNKARQERFDLFLDWINSLGKDLCISTKQYTMAEMG